MDQSFTLIPALTPQNTTSPILVRATRIWESINKKTSQIFHTNVVLLDQEDNQIVAMVPTSESTGVLYPPEYLPSLRFSGLPNHELEFKAGAPIMLLRNLNPKEGLCSGTSLIIPPCYSFVLEAAIITGNKNGESTYIPRISMSPADETLPSVLKRKQLPAWVCYAMTINESQGQTVKNEGSYLPKPVFSHGQLYAPVSRVTSPQGLRILCVSADEKYVGFTTNIVCHEVFSNI